MNTASVPRGVVPIPSDSDITKNVQIAQPSQSKSESMNVETNVVDSRKKHVDVDDAAVIVAVTDLKSARTTKSFPSSKRGW